eukprot:2712106-Pleurochrysis_carterae.AAC.1
MRECVREDVRACVRVSAVRSHAQKELALGGALRSILDILPLLTARARGQSRSRARVHRMRQSPFLDHASRVQFLERKRFAPNRPSKVTTSVRIVSSTARQCNWPDERLLRAMLEWNPHVSSLALEVHVTMVPSIMSCSSSTSARPPVSMSSRTHAHARARPSAPPPTGLIRRW